MKDTINKDTKLAFVSWLVLIVLTVLSVYLIHFVDNRALYVGVALLIVSIKGQQIIDIFMELKQAPKLWRVLLLSYVVVIPFIIGLIYLI
ncbi:cytochrome C oxidase subunit IV family protein [Colwellia sp. RSH04]|uniref:cytochrome C oxidase subunit IV family protein n=1 Tax=Colwellia sp. RSH04 TaxID=2305464 RepID=UPI0015FBC8AD|nr:cytochrome C oxidase subunit IV family protein [Colwellia sp. RSH04]